jgi:hypothetical protein
MSPHSVFFWTIKKGARHAILTPHTRRAPLLFLELLGFFGLMRRRSRVGATVNNNKRFENITIHDLRLVSNGAGCIRM